MIMIDETQDFDIMMLNMLLADTTIPKIFVGDPNQSIYQFRGCINGFNHLPPTALIVEFYSTFRIGDPACEIIRTKFKDCWMISKSNHNTLLTHDIETIKDEKYTYLCRSWRHLLSLAQTTKDIWICNYDEQCNKMRKLHTVLSTFGGNIDNEEFSDDLPLFLRSITIDELEKIISTIEENITSKSEAKVKFYTIHAYKGLEDDNVRIANDNDEIGCDEEGDNLYYVALTRGMKNIIEDITVEPHPTPPA
jgi:superfamily I DNA/RNA helicase